MHNINLSQSKIRGSAPRSILVVSQPSVTPHPHLLQEGNLSSITAAVKTIPFILRDSPEVLSGDVIPASDWLKNPTCKDPFTSTGLVFTKKWIVRLGYASALLIELLIK